MINSIFILVIAKFEYYFDDGFTVILSAIKGKVFVNVYLHCFPLQCLSKSVCYTSQHKYVSWLEENVSRAIGQNSMTP